MKTSITLRSLSLSLAVGAFLTACGGDSGNSQRIPGGGGKFVIAQDEILEPAAGETVACLQPTIRIRVPVGNLCDASTFASANESIFLVQKDTSDKIPLGIVTKVAENSEYCELETNPTAWLFPETEYVLSTALDASGSVILTGSNARKFQTGTYADNRSCGNALRIVDNNASWRKSYLYEIGAINENGDREWQTGEFGELFQDALSEVLPSVLGLSTLSSGTKITIPFNYKPSSFFLENNVVIRKISLANAQAYLSGGDDAGFQEVNLQDCDTPDGSCYEITQDDNGRWYMIIHPDNAGWESGYLYIYTILESLQSSGGKFMNATYLRAESR